MYTDSPQLGMVWSHRNCTACTQKFVDEDGVDPTSDVSVSDDQQSLWSLLIVYAVVQTRLTFMPKLCRCFFLGGYTKLAHRVSTLKPISPVIVEFPFEAHRAE